MLRLSVYSLGRLRIFRACLQAFNAWLATRPALKWNAKKIVAVALSINL